VQRDIKRVSRINPEAIKAFDPHIGSIASVAPFFGVADPHTIPDLHRV
jgi:hypothetical protein